MTIKTELANGTYEIFESQGYNVSTIKDMHPMILSVTIFDNGKKIFKKSRFFKWWYKHVTFKSAEVQKKLEEIAKQKENI